MKTLVLVCLFLGGCAEVGPAEVVAPDAGAFCPEEVTQTGCCVTADGTQGIRFPAVYGPCVPLCEGPDCGGDAG